MSGGADITERRYRVQDGCLDVDVDAALPVVKSRNAAIDGAPSGSEGESDRPADKE